MKSKFFLFLLTAAVSTNISLAQSANFNGTGTAPNFTLTDMQGNSHQLYSYLDSGKTVVLKFMSVFCGACGMHAQPTEDFWDNLGPNGTDQVMVLGMEINAASDSADCQNYINNYNITHPLIDNASSFGLGYSVTYTPTYYVVYPDYTYTPVCYQSCDYTTGPSTIEATLTNLVNDWTPQVNDLIISEYAEGTSYNKYIEIYNGTAYDVDLSSYELWKITNGGIWPEQTQALNGVIESGETFVIAHSAADSIILSSADFTSSICSFNGNDAIGLAKFDGNNFILIDAVGSDGADPGDGWEVSSEPDATKDHTLIRQNSVCNPEINWSIGSTQWEVQAVNSWANIGVHSGCLNTLPTVLGCTNPQANNYNPSANSDDGSCIVPSVEINNPSNSTVTSFNSITVQYLVNHFRVGTPDPLVNGHIHYFLDGVMTMQYDTSAIELINLSNGSYTFIIELVDNNHQSFNPPISDTLFFTVNPNINGCTDSSAFNFNANATIDDGSCFFVTNPQNHTIQTVGMLFSPDTLNVLVGDTITFNIGDFHNAVEVDSSTYVANGATANGGFSFGEGIFHWVVPQAQTYYYVCQPHAFIGMKGIIIASQPINGCTDPTADNYDASATQDDGSCTYTAVCNAPTGLNTYDVVHTRATFNFTSTGADYYKIRVKENGGSWQVITQLGTATGTPGGSTKTKYFLTADASYEWQVRAWCIDGQVSGWSTSAFFNTLPECPNATNQYASDVEAEWAVLNWDAPTNTVAGVNYYLARIQEDGASSWNIVSPGNGGTDNFKLKGQLTPGATYNFETRTWCNTGDSNNPTDPYYKSDWGGMLHLQTIPCPVQTFNLYTSNVNATTQFFGADFIADGNVPYDHFTLRFREVGATAWTFRSITAAHIAAGGRNVGALTTGAEYEWGIRTFCGTGSTWKSPWESGPNFVAGSSARLAAPVTALEVYPNPSRDIFNVSFTSEEAQTINVKVVNVIGEVVYSESLKDFQGSYEKGIDLTQKAKGVYFLEITTITSDIKKKIVLQ